MKNKLFKGTTLCLAAVLVLFLAGGCAAPAQEQEATASSIEVTDQLGRTVELDKTPERIVSLAPSNTELLFALGLGDKIVGVTTYCDYPPEALEKPKIGGFSTPDLEKVVALSPDLVVATSIHEDKIIPQLEEKGISVLALDPVSIDAIFGAIALLGKVTGTEDEASQLTADMQSRIKAVTDKTAGIPENDRPRVLYLTWYDPLMTSGSGTLISELLEKAGGDNIFLDVSGTKTIDLETLVARNPQVMIAGIGMGTGEDKPLQYLQTEPRLKSTDAAKNGNVYGVDMNLMGRGGPRIVDGLELLAKCIHPELFGQPGN